MLTSQELTCFSLSLLLPPWTEELNVLEGNPYDSKAAECVGEDAGWEK